MDMSRTHISRDLKLIRITKRAHRFARLVGVVTSVITVVLIGLDVLSAFKK